MESIVGELLVVSWELGVGVKILVWDLDYIIPICFRFVFHLEIFAPPCVGVSGCDLCLNLHHIPLIL